MGTLLALMKARKPKANAPEPLRSSAPDIAKRSGSFIKLFSFGRNAEANAASPARSQDRSVEDPERQTRKNLRRLVKLIPLYRQLCIFAPHPLSQRKDCAFPKFSRVSKSTS